MFQDGYVKVAVMGATGTGKSTFIQHLTNDANIHIGHNPESETSDVQTAYYTDAKTGRSIMLIDTPGFDDSEGLTDTDILQKIIDFLQPEKAEEKKLNGIIYMHRISDPRVGGLSRKNLRMFQALCGEQSLRNVRIVTTYWDRVDEQEGPEREGQLKKGAFQSPLMSGAQMRRYFNNVRSAQAIMAELIPLRAVSTQLQDQVAHGMALGDTAAGRIVNEDIEELINKHADELANLRWEMEEAGRARNGALRAELDAERRVLEAKVRRAEEDQARLNMTVDTLRNEQKISQEELRRWKFFADKETAKLWQDRARAERDAWQWRVQLDRAEKQRLQDLADKQWCRDPRNAVIKKREAEEARRRQQEVEWLAAEAEQNAAMLQQRIEAIDAQERKAETYANRGMFSRFLHDIGSVTEQWAEEGDSAAGPLGGLIGGLAGLGVAPLVAFKRAVVGRH